MISTASSPLFLFYLVNASGQTYYLDPTGSVRPIGRPTPLNYSPDGWGDISLGYERNLQKFGLVRNFSVSLGFFGDGAQILKYLYLNRNIDERVWLVVQKREIEVTDTDFYVWYPIYYKGEIDLSTFKLARGKVSVSIMEGGRSKELAANSGTAYELPVDLDHEAIRVRFPGIELKQVASFLFPSGVAINAKDYVNVTMPTGLIAEDTETGGSQDPTHTVSGGTATGTAFFSQNLELVQPDNPTYVNNSANYLLVNNAKNAITYRIQGVLNYVVTRNDTGNGRLILGFLSNTFTTDTDPGPLIPTPAVQGVGGTFSIAIDQEITLPPGGNLFIHGVPFNPQQGVFDLNKQFIFQILESSTFTITFSNAYPPSFVKVLPAYVAFQRFINRISGDKKYAVSQLLQASTVCLTCGDALRGLAGSAIKSTFDQYVNTFSRLYCAGLGVEGTQVVFEGRDYFLNDKDVYDLGEVKGLEVTPYTAIMCNSIECGYTDQSYENNNGRYEFNALSTFVIPAVQRVSRKLDLKLDYRGDYFGAEFARINLQNKLTVDASSDNDTWILDVDLQNPQADALGTYYELRRLAYDSVQGIPDPNVANVELSPKRILLNWRDWLRSVFYGYEASSIDFEMSTKNANLVTSYKGQIVAEFDGLALNGAGRLLFKPVQLSVTGVAGINITKILALAPSTCFSFTYQGISFKGFLLKGSIKPKGREEQQFIFLSHADNNLNLLQNAE